MSKRDVEIAAIACAEHYAAANGHRGDKRVTGLVLVGMAIAARLPESARRELAEGYDEGFPEQEQVMDTWARLIAGRRTDA